MARKLTEEEIGGLATRPGVRQVAVENFLMSLPINISKQDNIANLRMDARSYGWNLVTQKAIEDGIYLAYKERGGPLGFGVLSGERLLFANRDGREKKNGDEPGDVTEATGDEFLFDPDTGTLIVVEHGQIVYEFKDVRRVKDARSRQTDITSFNIGPYGRTKTYVEMKFDRPVFFQWRENIVTVGFSVG